jgi:hypothetical protein
MPPAIDASGAASLSFTANLRAGPDHSQVCQDEGSGTLTGGGGGRKVGRAIAFEGGGSPSTYVVLEFGPVQSQGRCNRYSALKESD